MIDAVSFGTITIDGIQFTSDLILYPDGRVVDAWWRKSGHRLTMGDISALLEAAPDVIVAGTGVNGRVVPDADLAETLAEKGIAFFAAPNRKAAQIYNDRCREKRAGACFHLTC
jgi:hypothetical protein